MTVQTLLGIISTQLGLILIMLIFIYFKDDD